MRIGKRRTLYCVTTLVALFILTAAGSALAFDRAYEDRLIARAQVMADLVHAAPSDGESPAFRKCGTPLTYEIFRAWPELSSIARERLRAIVTVERPQLSNEEVYDHDTPEGGFRIHYTRTGLDSVDMSFGVGEGNVPVYVLTCAAYLDTTVAKLVTELGYRFPLSDQLGRPEEDPRYDIYFLNLGASFYGRTWAEQGVRETGKTVVMATSWMEINSDFSQLFGYRDNPLDAMAVTVAHELHHGIQWSYDAFEAEDRQGDESGIPWFFELTSTHLEDVVFDDVNDYYLLMPFFFRYPWYSLRTVGPSQAASLHPYASAIWGHFLRQKYGDALLRRVWEECGNVAGFNTFDAYEKVLSEDFGSSFKDEWAEYLIWNYFTGDRATSWSYEEGADFGSKISNFDGAFHDSLVMLYDSYPLEVTTNLYPGRQSKLILPPTNTDELGVTYLRFIPGNNDSVPDFNLQLSYEGQRDFLVVTAGIRRNAVADNMPAIAYTTNTFNPVTVANWSQFDEILVAVSPFRTNAPNNILDTNIAFTFAVADSFATDAVTSAVTRVYSNPLELTAAGDAHFQVDISLAEPAAVSMYIYTPAGGLVAGGKKDGMFLKASEAGRNPKLRWAGVNRDGAAVASGVYLALIQIGDRREIIKVAVKNMQ